MSGLFGRKVKNGGIRSIYGIAGGATSKVLSFTGSRNGSVETLFTGAVIDETVCIDVKNNVVACGFFDGATCKVLVGTISGSSISYGSAVSISTVAASARVRVALNDTGTLLAVAYASDATANKDFTIKTYTISGTTLTADQTLTAATGSATIKSYQFCYLSGSRWVLFYKANTTDYPTVLGITASSGSLTKDASAVTVQSTAMNDTDYLAAKPISSTVALVSWEISGAGKPRYAPITDGGTSLSAGTVVQYAVSISGPSSVFIANNSAYIAFSSGATYNDSLYSGGVISGGAVTSEWTSSADSFNAFYLRSPNTLYGFGSENKSPDFLGNVDSDGVQWAVIPTRVGASTPTEGWIMFVGISTNAKKPIFVVTQLGTTLTSANASFRVKAINSQSFLVVYFDTGSDLKSLVVNL